MGLISRVSSRTYRVRKKILSIMIRRAITLFQKSGPINTLGFPPTRVPMTQLKKDEPLENYASWDTQHYINNGVDFYDLIHNMQTDRLDRDIAVRKKISNLDGIQHPSVTKHLRKSQIEALKKE